MVTYIQGYRRRCWHQVLPVFRDYYSEGRRSLLRPLFTPKQETLKGFSVSLGLVGGRRSTAFYGLVCKIFSQLATLSMAIQDQATYLCVNMSHQAPNRKNFLIRS